MKPKRRNGRDDAEAALRMQLEFAEAMLGGFAKGTEAWKPMWGPLGRPAIEAMEVTVKAQRLYLEELKETLD
jgi:hypothetical protein